MKEWFKHLLENIGDAHQVLQCLPYRHEDITPDPPDPMDTFGNLVDKLVTVNLKMWHNQEVLYEIRRMTPDEFKVRWGDNLDELRQVIGRCCDLNVQRSGLMDELDKFLKDAIGGTIDKESLVQRQHKTY